MKKTRRRDFLKAGVSPAVAMGSAWPFTTCRGPAREPSPEINAQVAAIRGEKLDSMTRDAIDALGGIGTVVNKGETVFIKPKFVSFPWAQYNKRFHVGECTKPGIIIAATEECLKAGAAEVVIGEGSHLPKFDWQYAITLDGSTNLVKEAKRLNSLYDGKVTLACLKTGKDEGAQGEGVTGSQFGAGGSSSGESNEMSRSMRLFMLIAVLSSGAADRLHRRERPDPLRVNRRSSASRFSLVRQHRGAADRRAAAVPFRKGG